MGSVNKYSTVKNVNRAGGISHIHSVQTIPFLSLEKLKIYSREKHTHTY